MLEVYCLKLNIDKSVESAGDDSENKINWFESYKSVLKLNKDEILLFPKTGNIVKASREKFVKVRLSLIIFVQIVSTLL